MFVYVTNWLTSWLARLQSQIELKSDQLTLVIHMLTQNMCCPLASGKCSPE